MTGTNSLLTRLLGTTNTARDYKLAENYVLLRDAVFEASPDSLGIVDARMAEGVWGLVMETGYPETVASLVALADGTVSLYFSNGGGMIGLGSHKGPRLAARALLKIAGRFVEYCDPTNKYPLPSKQEVRFYLFNRNTTLTVEADEFELSSDAHPLSPLFHLAHELISEIRTLDENGRA